ncbi:MAG: family 43 glycosylhydrolase [Eubacterium sp.]|nr:family 43 glycosylhydrolase [Eubacterium sp.]
MKKMFTKLLCLVLVCVMAAVPCGIFMAADSTPVLRYDFENAQGAPSLYGNAALVYDEDKGGNVLSLDGTDGTYAALPQGFFDGRNTMTITFDVLAKNNGGNYFTFCFGQDSDVYSFFRMRDSELRNAITRWSWQNEHEVKTTLYNSNIWNNIALVFSGTNMKLYVNGTLADENSNTEINVSDMGSNLLSYLGKSLYDGDGYFCGCFDNFEVYNTALGASDIAEIAGANLAAVPILRYTFEDSTVLPDMFGNAATAYDSDRASKVLSLDGTTDTYAALPQGFFDGRNTMTVMFDVKPQMNSGNYFTFAFGQDTTRYDFFRVRGTEVRNAITVSSYYNEHEVKTALDYSDAWISVAIVFDGTTMKLYANGELAATNNNTGIRVSDLGSDLLAYLGKSFYDGDGYFKGCFDNFEVYDKVVDDTVIKERATAHLPLLISATVGNLVNNLDGISGTDSHTALQTTIDRSTNTVSAMVQRRQNTKAVPVLFNSLNDECRFFVDDMEVGAASTLDLTYDRTVKIVCGDKTEQYTLKAVTTARNPVLPGMYADPDIDVLDGKFWIFPTTDGTPGWGGTQFHAFSSKDMVHWIDEGVILDNKDKSPGENAKCIQIASCAWSDGNAWAPSIEEKDGKYYFYFCGRILDNLTSTYGDGMAIGVAWADSPAGPYTASDTPLLYPKMMSDANFGFAGQVIDPAIYTENGTSYILFGNGSAAIATLGSDMVSVDTSSLRLLTGLTDFRESIAVFKRNSTYYFHWSCDDTGSENYHINYGTASSLTGMITYQGTLVQKDSDSGILATGHQSIIYLPESDRCFIAYHRFYTPLSVGGNVGHRRETCIDEVTFYKKSTGLFSSIYLLSCTPTMAGVGPIDTSGNNITETVVEPTCTHDGSIVADGFTLTADEAPEVKAPGHQFFKTTAAPTCTDNGYDAYTCTACGETYTDNFTQKLGHDLDITATNASSHFRMTCSRGDLDKSFAFADYVNAEPGDNNYDADIDLNGDGIINGRDLAALKEEANK